MSTESRLTPDTARAGIELRPDTVVDIADLLRADAFAVVENEVTFTLRKDGLPMRWTGHMGDRLVPEGEKFWRIVPVGEPAHTPEGAEILTLPAVRA